ncbi:MAG: polysaccharide biosynthesis/export family protein [Terracidiphilus sp.]|jgi:polysaccharide export outer membrane protein
MKIYAKFAFSACVLSVFLLCGGLRGQVAGSTPPGSTTPAAQTPASPAQPDASSKVAHADDSYVIGDDDVLGVSVWKEPDLSKEIPVRSDGKISLPLIGEVDAAGRTPLQLEQEISSKLKNFITDPHVTVIVEKINSQKFNILGEVAKPGSYSLSTGETIVDAVAIAGGFKDFAKRKSIYVLRQSPGGEQSRINFNYQDFIKGKDTAVNIVLRPGDTIVVP